MKAIISLLGVLLLPMAAFADVGYDEKRCILLAATKLPAIPDLHIAATSTEDLGEVRSAANKIAADQISTIYSTADAKRVIAGYRSLSDAESAEISAQADLQKLREKTAQFLKEWAGIKVVAYRKKVRISTRLLDMETVFEFFCELPVNGSAPQISSNGIVH